MYNSNGTITGNVDIRDVQSCCPVTLKRTVNGVTERRGSGDVGVLIGSKEGDIVPDSFGGAAWTVSSRIPINKWAKYKPIKCSGLGRQGYAKRVETNFGIAYIPVFVGKFLGSVADYVFDRIRRTSGQSANVPECDVGRELSPYEEWEYWVYDRPTGGSASPFRLTDFRSKDETTYHYNGADYQINGGAGDANLGYFRRALPPLQELAPDDGSHADGKSILNASSTGTFVFSFPQNLDGVSAGLTVRYEDLNMGQGIVIGNFYFGILFRPVGGSTFYAITQRSTAGGQGGTWVMGNAVRMALQPDENGYHRSAYNILGRELSADIEYVPFMSSIVLSGAQMMSDFYYPDESVGTDSGTFLALDMVPRTVHLSITKARADIIDAVGETGTYPTKRGIKVSFKLRGATDEVLTVRVTVNVYDSYVVSNPIGTKTVTISGVTDELGLTNEITMVQGADLPTSFTAVMAVIDVTVTTANSATCQFKENTTATVYFSSSSGGGGGGGGDNPSPYD